MPLYPAIDSIPAPAMAVTSTPAVRPIQLTPGRATRIRVTAYRAEGCDGAALVAIVPQSRLQAVQNALATFGQPLWPRAALEEFLLYTETEQVWYIAAVTAADADPLTLYIQQWLEVCPADVLLQTSPIGEGL